MSSKSWIVDTKESLLIVDTQAFPINLGVTVREDSPEGSFRILAYEGSNILPTALGYRSYFSDSSLFDVPALPSEHCQKVLAWQTPSLDTFLLAFCEEGVYWTLATEGSSGVWALAYATGNDPASGVRHLWTTAVVANRLCAYCQGQSKYWVFADLATANNIVTQAALTKFAAAGVVATLEYQDEATVVGFVSVKPSFINMAGQQGLFRADNRLGFWDSDNAVAWSSATQVFDFTPSTETFAGITTFAKVQGQITLILGHGDAFVIYATKSIVLASGLQGSPERWSGTAVMSDAGCVFDTQITAAEPDTTHYALTSAGLVRVNRGTAEFVHTEVSDYIQEKSSIVSLAYLDGRYLFMYTTEDLNPAKVEVDSELVTGTDFDGIEYKFQPTTPEGAIALHSTGFEVADPSWLLYRNNSMAGASDISRWTLDSTTPISGLRSARTTAGWSSVVWLLDLWTLFSDFDLVGTPEAPIELTIKVKIRVNKPNPAGILYLFANSAPGVPSIQISAPGEYLYDTTRIFSWTGGPISPANNTLVEFFGSAGATTEVRIDDLQLALGADGPILTGIISGTSARIQNGFTNFAASDPGAAAFAKANDYPLVPCFSGGDFKSTWDEGVELELRLASRFLNLPYGIAVFVGSLDPWVRAKGNTTQMGPSYRDPEGFDKVRIVDKAGVDMQELLTEMNSRAAAQLLGTQNNLLFTSDLIGDLEVKSAATATAMNYPTTATVPNLVLSELIEPAVVSLEDVLIPGSTELYANECALIVGGLTDRLKYLSYLDGAVTLQDVRAFVSTVVKFDGSTWTFAVAISAKDLASAGIAVGLPGIVDEYSMRSPAAVPSLNAKDLYAALAAGLEIRGSYMTPGFGVTAQQIIGYLTANPELKRVQAVGAIEVVDLGPLSTRSVKSAIANLSFLSGAQLEIIDYSGVTLPDTVGEWELRTAVFSGDQSISSAGVVGVNYFLTDNPGQVAYGTRFGLYDSDYESPGFLDFTYVKVIGGVDVDSFSGRARTSYALSYHSDYATKQVIDWSAVAPPELVGVLNGVLPIRAVQIVSEDDRTGTSPTMLEVLDNLRTQVTVRPTDWEVSVTPRLSREWAGETNLEHKLLSVEVSGYGYFPSPGSNFRKTHARHSSTSCPIPGTPVAYAPGTANDPEFNYPPITGGPIGGAVKPPTYGPWPDPIDIVDTYALYKDGSFGLFYPTYRGAITLDTQLNKWGRYSNPHKLMWTLMPVNRGQDGILPSKDLGLRGGSLRPDGRLVNFAGAGRVGSITYGRIGNYRLGVTKLTHLQIRFAEPANCQVLIECSIDGAIVDPTLTQGITVANAVQVEIPFTMTAKWFNIRLVGSFNIVGISYESEARGRR